MYSLYRSKQSVMYFTTRSTNKTSAFTHARTSIVTCASFFGLVERVVFARGIDDVIQWQARLTIEGLPNDSRYAEKKRLQEENEIDPLIVFECSFTS